jgi:hypothetical protein
MGISRLAKKLLLVQTSRWKNEISSRSFMIVSTSFDHLLEELLALKFAFIVGKALY